MSLIRESPIEDYGYGLQMVPSFVGNFCRLKYRTVEKIIVKVRKQFMKSIKIYAFSILACISAGCASGAHRGPAAYDQTNSTKSNGTSGTLLQASFYSLGYTDAFYRAGVSKCGVEFLPKGMTDKMRDELVKDYESRLSSNQALNQDPPQDEKDYEKQGRISYGEGAKAGADDADAKIQNGTICK